MKSALLCGFVALVLAPLCSAPAAAALYRRELTISRSTGTPLSNVQAVVALTPANFDYAHVDPAGAFVRFTDSDGVTAIPYYRETWNPGGTSTCWLRIPALPGNGTKTLYLYYATAPGDIDETSSNFSATFPSAYVAPPGTTFLTPTPGSDPWEQVDWFQVGPANVLVVNSSGSTPQPFTVNARRIIVAGTLQANGSGYLPTFSVGQGGPGAGTNSSSFTGGGGGGHGGAGGIGGSSFGEQALGGPTSGSSTNATIQPGSSGGSSLEQPAVPNGGLGGGAVSLHAHRLDLTGTILANGTPGSESASGGGGGAGGGVLLMAHELRLEGGIEARGGNGVGSVQSGGGGGGGRIKVFHETAPVGTPTLSVNGGSTGTGGPFPDPGPGAAGSTHVAHASTASLDYDELAMTVGSELGLVSVEPIASIGIRVGTPAPNPARERVALAIDLDRATDGEIEILDLQGRRVRALARVNMVPGSREWSWDLRDDSGRPVSTGLFLARVRIADRTWTRRIVVAH